MDESRLELKVGLLALAALGIGVALVVALAGLSGRDAFVFYADFAYAGGIPAGAPVKLAGVKVGRVDEVQLRGGVQDESGRPLPVRLVVEIDRANAPLLRADAGAAVAMQGALGETYLEIEPGLAPEPLTEGGRVRGQDPVRLDRVLTQLAHALEGATHDDALRRFLSEVANLAEALNEVLGGQREEIVAALSGMVELVDDGKGAVREIRVAARTANALLSDPQVTELLSDLNAASKAAQRELPAVLGDARELMRKLDATVGALDSDDMARVRSLLTKLDSTATQLQSVSTTAEALLVGLERGEGTAGLLVKDPMVYEDLRALLADLKANPWKLVWKK